MTFARSVNTHHDGNNDKSDIKSYPRKRRVSYCPQVVLIREIADDEGETCTKSNSWYSQSELKAFRTNAEDEAKKYRLLSTKAVPSSIHTSSLVLPFRNCGLYNKMKYLVQVQSIVNKYYVDLPSEVKQLPEFRGIEGAIFPERQRNKTIARHAVLEFQRRANKLILEAQEVHRTNEEIAMMKQDFVHQLANLNRKLSEWSRNEALASANFDATGVYNIPKIQMEDNAATEIHFIVLL